MPFRLKRVYEAPSDDDGVRVLIDRLWPRGMTKEAARVDLWLKEIAPSTELRKWFGHEAAKWRQFELRYWDELSRQPEAVDRLRELEEDGVVTLLFATREERHHHGVALVEYLGTV